MKAKKLLSLLLAVMMVVGLVPLSIVSISAAELVKLNGSSESYKFTADSWTIDETTDNNKTSTLTTADGKTFHDEGFGYTSGRWQTNGGKATSVDSFDFSDGFEFTMTWTVLAPSGGKWGNKHVMDFGGFQVVICDAIRYGDWQKPTIDYYIGTGFSGVKDPEAKEGADKYTPKFENQLGYYNTGVQTSDNMTPEQMATLNTTFTVVYAGGYASLYVDSMKSTDNPTGIVTWTVDGEGTTATKIAVDASTMSNVQLSISKEWSWTNSQDVMVIDSLTGVDASDIETETETTPVETETEPAETETTPIESETTAITTDGEFTADSWIIADKTEDTSNPTVSTDDGKTFVTKVFQDGNANSPAIITSKAQYDLSNGFVFSFDADLCRQYKNSWSADEGGNTTTISFGDAVTLEINGTGYSLIVDGTRHKFGITVGNPSNYAPTSSEQVALVNANYKVKYADGKVSLYVNDSLITFSDGLSEIDVTGDLSASTVRIFRGWCWSTDTTTFASLKNLDLEITAAPTPVAPVYEGVQEGTVDDVFSVRFVGTVDSLNYSEVGFKVTELEYDRSWTKGTNVVYSKLIGNTDTGVVEYTEENLNGQYIYALTIQGVPTEGTVTFNVTAYGIVDGVKVVGKTYAVTYTDGAYVGTFAVD